MTPEPIQPDPQPGMLELRLLGQGKAVLDGQELHFPIRKTLALLAYLALEGSTPRGTLAGLFWSDNTDEDARRNLRRELHRLRETGLRTRIITDGERVGLAGPVISDVERFQTTLEAGDVQAALGWYGGTLLEGLTLDGSAGFEEWLELRRERLSNARRRATLELAERLETKGDWRRALELHLLLLDEDALQERQHRQVMRLHYLLGEREAALTQFERCRVTLGTELGLEPLPETVALAERIRAARNLEPAVAVKPVSIGQLRAPLVGREPELRLLSASAAPLLLLLGEPGVGKSRLALEFAGAFPSNPPQVSHLTVHFSEAARTPLSAVAEAIRASLSDPTTRTRLEALEPVWKRELARLMPDIDPQDTTPDAPSAEGRNRFLEGLSHTVSVLARTTVWDDLHWADAASLELIAHLARRAGRDPQASPRLIVTARTQELEANAAATHTLDALERDGLVARVHLGPLGESEIRALVEGLSGNPGAHLFSRRLHRVTAGNPFFALETIRYLFETGDLRIEPAGGWSTRFDETTTDYAELPIPPSVRQAVLERVDRLGPASQRLLETAALTSDGFTLEEIQPATALSDWESLEGLERAVNAQVLIRLESGYRFAHDLTRSALGFALSPERRRLIHLKLAASLEAQASAPARIATHLEQAGKATKAVPWWVKAAEAAERLFAYREALEHFEHAVTGSTDLRSILALREKMLRLHEFLDWPERWEADLIAYEATAEQIGDPGLRVDAALERTHFLIWYVRDNEALERAQWVLRQPELTMLQRAWALEYTAHALVNLGQLAESDAARTEVIELLRDKPSGLRGRAMYGRLMNAYKRGDYAEARDWAARCREEFTTIGATNHLINVCTMEGILAAIAGDSSAAVRSLETARDEARRVGQKTHQIAALFNLFEIHFESGHIAQARAALQEAAAVRPVFFDPFEEAAFVRYQSKLAWFTGELGHGLALARRALELDEQSNVMEHRLLGRLVLSRQLLETGDAKGARDLLEQTERLIEESSIGFFSFTLGLRWSQLDLLAQRAASALERLLNLEPLLSSARADEVTQRSLLIAQAHARLGDLESARAVLDLLTDAHSLENRAHLLTLRCALGDANALHEAPKVLESDTVPAVRSLELCQVVAAALEVAGQQALALAMRRKARRRFQAMLTSLEQHSALRACFLETHRNLATE